VAQAIEYLPGKCETLGSNHQYCQKEKKLEDIPEEVLDCTHVNSYLKLNSDLHDNGLHTLKSF
jgi:hypothetical protein